MVSYSSLLFGQETSSVSPKHWPRATVRQEQSSITITANAACPIRQAVAGLRTTFGWPIDFEEAPADAEAELSEHTSPEWQAAHPSDPRAFRKGLFVSHAPGNIVTLKNDSGKEAVLNKLVADYNASGYPGTYSVKAEGPGRFAVIGRYEGYPEGDSVLDTPITLPAHKWSAWDTLDNAILPALSAASGIPVKVASGPYYTLFTLAPEAGGAGVPARQLLVQTLTSTGWPLVWELSYEPKVPAYSMRIHVIGKDKLGRQPLDPID
jgi:hypothetical protein